MKCPYCNNENIKVIDSRDVKEKNVIRRRRECLNCKKRFSTIESIVKLDIQVKKNNGEIEDFDFNKIKKGIIKACDKRPVTLEDIDLLTNKIIDEIKSINYDIIDSDYIGKIVIKHLKNLDEIAYLRFSLVYKRYDTIKEFLDDMKESINIKSK